LDFFFLFYLFFRCDGRGLRIQSFEFGLGDVEEAIWVFVPYPSQTITQSGVARISAKSIPWLQGKKSRTYGSSKVNEPSCSTDRSFRLTKDFSTVLGSIGSRSASILRTFGAASSVGVV